MTTDFDRQRVANEPCATHFPSPERAAPDTVLAQSRKIAADRIAQQLLDAFPDPVVILNPQRQIVAANDRFVNLPHRSGEDLLGMRPGEALNCIHAGEEPAGCGATAFCRYCGAARSIVMTQQTRETSTDECRILCRQNNHILPLNFRVWARPLRIGSEVFTVFVLRDIADEYRRKTLERIFFHDLLNIATGLKGAVDLWPALDGNSALAVHRMAGRLVQQLIDEIEFQRELVDADRGDLQVCVHEIDAVRLLDEVCEPCRQQFPDAANCLTVAPLIGAARFQSDERLLRRVLGNLVKNAIEASSPGQVVTVSFDNNCCPTFRVHNEATIPEEVQAQLFQRSFTTKSGAGRGIGTYSVKLLTEKYLNGTVEFVSTPETGTRFTVRLLGS